MNFTVSDMMPNPNNGHEDNVYGLLKTFKMQKVFFKIIKQKFTYVCEMILALF